MPNHKHPKIRKRLSNRFKLFSLFFLLTVFSLALLLTKVIGKFLEETDFFNISYIKIVNRPVLGNVPAKYFYDLVGAKTSIFEINLKHLEEKVEDDFPQLEKAVITKSFPNGLAFNLIARRILAQISLGKKRYFDVDLGGFILPVPHSELKAEFPLILGLEPEVTLIIPDRSTTSERLLYALSFIKEYRDNNWLPQERLVAVDVFDNYGLSIFLEGNLEVKILHRDVKHKIKVLEGLLKEIKMDNQRVKCIDLRFKDVIINPKND